MANHTNNDLDPAFQLYQPTPDRSPMLKRVLIVLTIVVGVSLVGAAGVAVWLNSSMSNIGHVGVTVKDENRPAPVESDSLNILLLGADAGTARNGPGTSIIKDAAKDVWPRGKYRSDATLLVQIDPDREHAYVISIPRDSYLPVHDQTGQKRETTKVNAALSLYGPSGALSTVENFANLRIDHLAMVDWDGFEAITDAVGGVPLTVDGQKRTLRGTEALQYVRQRKSLPQGDFDRVKRQQNFLRALMSTVIKRGTPLNPIRLKKTLNSITENLAVDDGWSDDDIRSLALSMRDTRPKDVTFLTIPTKGTESDPQAGSIVLVDEAACEVLFDAMRNGTMKEWVDAHGDTVLGNARLVD